MPVQILDYSLASLKVPGLEQYEPPFGTKKADGQGLTTAEINRNILLPFLKQRSIAEAPLVPGNDPLTGVITQDSFARPIEFNAAFAVGPGITLRLDFPSFEGQVLTITGSFTEADAVSTVIPVPDGTSGKFEVHSGETITLTAVNGEWSQSIARLAARLASLESVPTSLQTTDPPSFHAVRVDVAEGGSGYALDDLVHAGDPSVDLTVTAINEDGAILHFTHNAELLYSGDPAGNGVPVTGGSGSGAMCDIRTAYAPGDLQRDGELQFVPYGDPLVQTSRLKGYVRDFLLSTGLAQNVTRLNAMRKWSPAYLYGEAEAAFFDGKWWIINPDNPPVFNESPETNPEKWQLVAGKSDARNESRIDDLWDEIFGEGTQFSGSFILDFYTLDGVNLEEGVWKEAQGIVEV
jgi:hypothetical protein